MEGIGIAAALLSAASWAFGTLMFDRLGKYMAPAAITFVKGSISLLLMVVIMACTGGFSPLSWQSYVLLAISGIVGIAIGDTLFFKSLSDLGAKTQVLFFLLGQIMTMLLSFLLLDERLTLLQYVGAFILLAGVVIVTWGKQEGHPNKGRGICFGLLSILCFSMSSIVLKYSVAEIDAVPATFYRMLFGTVGILFVGVTSRNLRSWVAPLRQTKVLGAFMLNVVVITLGGFLLSTVAIKNISVSLASVLSTTEPIFVLLFAALIWSDKATRRELLGAAVTIGGLLIIMLHESLC